VRLYPAFWACCTLTALGIWVWGAPRYAVGGVQYLVNMTMLAEFVKVAPVDGVYWSLIVEIKFYVMVAVLLALRRLHQVELFLLGWLLLGYAMQWRPVWTVQYALVTEYCAYFAAGSAFYLVWQSGLTARRAAILALAYPLALWQSVAALPAFERSLATSMSRPVVLVLVTLCFLAMAAVAWRRTGALRWGNFTLVGAITYPLYLLHQNLGYIAFNQLHGLVNVHLLFWGVIGAMVALSYAVHRCVERPLAKPAKAWLQRLLGLQTRP
jgi:peptidoglycan/LPS O-acetylase OafA/YrhL